MTTTIVEFGPGTGNLTNQLLKKQWHVIGVEIDQKLIAHLQARFNNNHHLILIQEDMLKTNLADLAAQCQPLNNQFAIVANLPYYLSSAFLMKMFLATSYWSTMIVMVQKEVADRLMAKPHTKAYGALSVICQFFTTANLITVVLPTAFYPQPKVTSAVIKLTPKSLPPWPKEQIKAFINFVHACFAYKRKTLINNLKASNLAVDLVKLNEFLLAHHLPSLARAEELELSVFIELFLNLNRLKP